MGGGRIIALVVVTLFAVPLMYGCAYNPPIYNAADPARTENKAELAIGYDDAWRKGISVLAAEGYSIKVSNKQDGIITTDKKLVRLNETQADCGNIWGLPYTKDTRTTTNVSLSLFLRDAAGKTAITVNAQIEGIFNATAMDSGKQLSCYSTGYVEKNIIYKLSR